METRSPPSDLELIVAHGARMSRTGLLRPRDEFCRCYRARLATLSAEREPPLERYFGAWSARNHRFTANLSTPRVRVRPEGPEEPPGEGIRCILYRVDRVDGTTTGPGGVCLGDGWPVELWKTFLARSHGVEFGIHDRIVDEPFERGPEMACLAGVLTELESRRVADPAYGSLSRLDRRTQ